MYVRTTSCVGGMRNEKFQRRKISIDHDLTWLISCNYNLCKNDKDGIAHTNMYTKLLGGGKYHEARTLTCWQGRAGFGIN